MPAWAGMNCTPPQASSAALGLRDITGLGEIHVQRGFNGISTVLELCWAPHCWYVFPARLVLSLFLETTRG